MANTLFFLGALPLPAIIAWLSLWYTHDAIISLVLTISLGLIVPIIVYDKVIGDFSFERKIPEEIMNKDEKIKTGIIYCVGAAFGLGIFRTLFSMFVDEFFGPTSITLPFPSLSGWIKWIYIVVFVLLWIVLAVTEHVFFNFFSSIEYTEKEGGMASLAGEKPTFSSNLILSLGVGLLHFAFYYWIVKPILFFAVIYGILAVIVNFVVITIRHDKKMIVSVLLKIGLAIGVLLYLWYLNISLNGNLKRETPVYFFNADVENKFSTWFGN